MSISPLASVAIISPNSNNPRNNPLSRISIHCFVAQVTAKRGCEVFQPVAKRASANYIVGYDGSIGCAVDEDNRSWCTSSADNDNRAITIEVASDTKHPYAVTDTAYDALLNLLTDICKRHGKRRLVWIPDKDKALSYTVKSDELLLTVHRWFAVKACPGEYLYERHAQIAETVNSRLAAGGDEPSSYAKEAWDWAVTEKITDGSSPQGPCTREQVVTMLYRYHKKGDRK